jgi:hypothetical protein
VAQEYRYMPPAEMVRMAHAGAVGQIHQVSIREHREPLTPCCGRLEPVHGKHWWHVGAHYQSDGSLRW